jgi:hypothetical protein
MPAMACAIGNVVLYHGATPALPRIESSPSSRVGRRGVGQETVPGNHLVRTRTRTNPLPTATQCPTHVAFGTHGSPGFATTQTPGEVSWLSNGHHSYGFRGVALSDAHLAVDQARWRAEPYPKLIPFLKGPWHRAGGLSHCSASSEGRTTPIRMGYWQSEQREKAWECPQGLVVEEVDARWDGKWRAATR